MRAVMHRLRDQLGTGLRVWVLRIPLATLTGPCATLSIARSIRRVSHIYILCCICLTCLISHCLVCLSCCLVGLTCYSIVGSIAIARNTIAHFLT